MRHWQTLLIAVAAIVLFGLFRQLTRVYYEHNHITVHATLPDGIHGDHVPAIIAGTDEKVTAHRRGKSSQPGPLHAVLSYDGEKWWITGVTQ